MKKRKAARMGDDTFSPGTPGREKKKKGVRKLPTSLPSKYTPDPLPTTPRRGKRAPALVPTPVARQAKGKRRSKKAAKKVIGKKPAKSRRKPVNHAAPPEGFVSTDEAKSVLEDLGFSAFEPPTFLVQLEMALGVELVERLQAVSTRRELPFESVLREAIQDYLEGELVEPTTPAKDDALYPPTDQPLEEFTLARGTPEPSEDESKVTETPAVDVTEN
jgi:hypothetical protein